MFRQKQIHQAVLAFIASGFAASVAAQQQPATDQAGQVLKRVEVTGSRIKRIDTETPAPVQIISREQIERSGALSISEVLQRLPAANVGSFNENAVASFSPGAASASLRGLGAQATLVLINGRRVAPFGFANGGQTTFVDVNQIPLEVVERIEILLDGASAVYGSDAIGGVINVILRRDYNGLMVSGGFGRSTHGDGDSKRGSITYGLGSLASDRYNAFINYEHVDQDSIKASRRSNTATSDFRRFGLLDSRSSYSYPGNLYVPTGATGGAFLGPFNGCAPLVEPGAATNGRCIYDFVKHTDLISTSKRDSVTLAGTADIGAGFQLFGDATFGRTQFKQESPSYGTNTYFSTGTLGATYIILDTTHPQNTTGAPVGLRYRFADVPFTTDVKTDTQRVVAGIRNPDFYGWDVESGVLYSHSKTGIAARGIINDEVLLNEVLQPDGITANNSFSFGNPSANDPALMGRLYPTLTDTGKTTTESIDVKGSRDLFQMPAGMLAVAVGAEFRRERFSSMPDPITASGVLSVLGASSAEGSRNVQAGYVELSIPVLRNLEVQAAARIDHYSDFGSTVNPKIGFKWKALPQLAIRGTYATGFRAPAITELSISPTRGFFNGVLDPQNCPTFDQNNPNCDLSVPATLSSNPGLKPEKSKSFTAGIIFEPVDNVSIAVDAFRIKRRNEITFVSPTYLLDHEAQYPGFVTRNPDGTINSFDLQYTNLGSTRVWGYDVEVRTSQNIGEIGKFGFVGAYDALPHYNISPVPGAPEVDYAGTWLQPKSRLRIGFTLDRGPWAAGLTFNYVGKYSLNGAPDQACNYAGTSASNLCTIASYLTTDLFLGYKGFKNLDLGLTITNLDNRQAPLDANMAGRFTLYRSDYHSAMGRYFQLSAKYKFF